MTTHTKPQHIYASKGQDGGTRKNKRATRKNKRPTLRPDAELRAYEHINRHGKQVMARYNVCYKKGCQKISAKTYKSFQKKMNQQDLPITPPFNSSRAPRNFMSGW